MGDTRNRIIAATFKAVRKYGLDGVRIQNISQFADLSPGALYRYFESKDELMVESFIHVDKQVAAIFEGMEIEPRFIRADPIEAVRTLWLPYFRFWTARPDETVFYHRFRDSELFPEYNRRRDMSHFRTFACTVDNFKRVFPALGQLNQDLLWHHVLTATVMYAKYVVEGTLPNDEETENTIFQLLTTGLAGYFQTQDGVGVGQEEAGEPAAL